MKTRLVSSVTAVLAVLALLVLGGCSNPAGGDPGGGGGGGGGDDPVTYTVGGTITLEGGSGTVVDVTVELKQGASVAASTKPGAGGVYSFSGVAAGDYTIAASLAGYDSAALPEFPVSADSNNKNFSLRAVGLPPPPTPNLNGNLWGSNAAVLSTSGQDVGIAVTWDAAGTAGSLGMPQEFRDRIDAANTVTVTFTKGGSDKIRFDRIAELRQALTDEGVSPSAIVMKSVTGGSEVFPLFNGDDLFGHPGNDTNGTNQSGNTGKVFYVYGNNEEIFDGFVVKNASGSSGPGTTGNLRAGWHIDNVGNKTIYVERLKFAAGPMDYLLGFGLKSAAAHRHFESGFTLTGRYSPSNTDSYNPIKLDHFIFPCARFKTTAFRRLAFSVNMCEKINIWENDQS